MSLSNDEFIEQLTALLTTRQGSVSITTKRFTYEPPKPAEAEGEVEMTDSAEASTSQERDYPLLYRATDGNGDKSKKVKLSTIVHPTALPAFTTAYTALLRQSVTFLRPKKKKQLKKSSATTPSASASKPTASAGTTFSRLPRLAGPKRGAGAHKRQRLKKRRAAQLGKMAARRRRDRP